MKITKKLLALILCLVMLLGIVPFGEFETRNLFGIKADAANVSGNDIVEYARKFIGYPYGHGYGPNIFDCCGLVQYVYKHFGISLPWNCYEYKNYGSVVSANDAQPGDLVVWHGKHVGIVSKKGYHVNAMNPKDGVKEVKIAAMTNGTPSYYIRIKGVNNSVPSQPVVKTANYIGGVKVTLTSQTSDAVIYYTTDGNNPTTGSTKYTSAFNISTTKTIKALAVKGNSKSGIISQKITVNKVATPSIDSTLTANGFNVTIKAGSGETIYYTTNGSTPTTNSSKYIAGINITENATIKAIAVKEGMANSDVASLSLTASVPGVPTLKLRSFDTIGVNDTIELSWGTVNGAASYKLIVSGAESKELDLGNITTTSYIAAKSGTYSFTIKAVNFKGESAASSPAVKVTVKPDVTVTFKVDGNTYATQTVRYGTSATEPAKPTKNGYDFDSWDKSFKNVTANTTVTAKFKAKKYTIKFLADDGSTIKEQSVEFGKAATVPASSPTKDGYVFKGWTLVNDSGSGTSYTKVDGDASFKPVFVWADPTLPLSVTINSAVRADDSRSYTVSIKVTNSKNQKFNAKAIAVIKTANDKVVASAIQNIEIPANASSKAYTVIVNSNESAMLCEVYIVNGDVKNAELTGGALSSKASKAVTKNASTSIKEWSGWSDWSTNAATKSDTLDVETKTQYSYRDKTTVTSYNSTMDGYTKIGEQWVDQGNTTVEYAENLPSGSSTTNFFKTDNALYVKYNNISKVKKASDSTDTVKYEQVSKTVKGYLYWHWCYTHDVGYPLNCYLGYNKGYKVKSGQTCNNFHAFFSEKPLTYNASKECYVKNSKSNCPYQENWFAGVKPDKTNNGQITVYSYVYKTYKKQYIFEKLSDASAWSDTKPVESDTRTIATRTLYRTRTLETKTVTASTEYKVTENTSGTKHTVSGNINNLSTDYSGKKATVMVYRTNNTDSTANQLEYVGQITLGTNNSYSVSFIPKEELSASTGDFVVALGIASADKEIPANRIEAPKQKFKVDFLDLDGKVISTQNIEQGKDATPPALPSKEGYIVTWSDSYKYINANRTIKAKKTAKTYPVVFVDWANSEVLSIQEVEYDSVPRFPSNPTAEGKIFKGWSLDSGSKITDTTVIEAIYDDITYTVKYLNKDGSVFDTQTVPYGGFASIPEENPTAVGYEFISWSYDTKWWNVTEDITVKPIFIFDSTVETPVATSEDTNFGAGSLMLETTTEDAIIHYTTDGSEPTEEDLVFDDIVWTEETTTFKAKAFKAGMNASDTVEITIDVVPEGNIPKVSALTNIAQYEIGENYAKICMRIDNPQECIIRAYGYELTNETTGETKYYENTDINGATDKVLGKVFNITGLDSNTKYTYVFFAEFDNIVLSSAPAIEGGEVDYFVTGTTGGMNNASLSIRTPSTTTVKYGHTLVLHLNNDSKIPENACVCWKYEGTGFKVEDKGEVCHATVNGKGDVIVSAVLCDKKTKEPILGKDGNQISSSVKLTANSGFFQKIIYFFKNLFGANLFIDL